MTDGPEWLAFPRPEEIYHELVHDGPYSCDTPHPVRPPQVIYTLHFAQPDEPYPDAPHYKCAGHYVGMALKERLRNGSSNTKKAEAPGITQVQREAGGTWRLAVQPGGADWERQLKQHGAVHRCPICKTAAEQAAVAHWQQATSS